MRFDSWGKLLSTSGSLASTLGKNNPFRYRGYVFDEETGFYYLQSRYYNPEVGRFISSDVLLSTGQGVLGHNAYAYCLNNPCRLSDSEGASATLAIGGTAIAFTSIFVLALCVCLIIDLATNQEQSLAQQFVSAIQTIVIDSIATVQAIWDGIVLSNKNQFFGKPGEIKDGPEDYKKTHIGEEIMCSTYDRSFHSFDELTDLLLRGGEIELLYKHTAYTIFPLFEENVITAIDVGIRPNYLEIPDPHQSILIYDWTPYPVDRIDEIGDIIIEGEKLRDILPLSTVRFRPD